MAGKRRWRERARTGAKHLTTSLKKEAWSWSNLNPRVQELKIWELYMKNSGRESKKKGKLTILLSLTLPQCYVAVPSTNIDTAELDRHPTPKAKGNSWILVIMYFNYHLQE